VDLVILATHGHFRPMHYHYAVKQGKHVFMEKPVAVDAPGIRQVLAANEEAKKKGLKVVVGLQRRHNLRHQETVKRLKDGAIGDIVLMRCYSNLGGFYADIDGGLIEGSSQWRFRASVPNPYQVEWDVLMDAIRNNKPHNEAEYGAISTMTTILGRMAADSGQMITWDEGINSKLRLGPEKYAFDAPAPVVPDAKGTYPVAMPGVSKAF
jgi:hypothetical protein